MGALCDVTVFVRNAQKTPMCTGLHPQRLSGGAESRGGKSQLWFTALSISADCLVPVSVASDITFQFKAGSTSPGFPKPPKDPANILLAGQGPMATSAAREPGKGILLHL